MSLNFSTFNVQIYKLLITKKKLYPKKTYHLHEFFFCFAPKQNGIFRRFYFYEEKMGQPDFIKSLVFEIGSNNDVFCRISDF